VRAGNLSEMPWREQVPGAPVWFVWVAVAVLVALRRRRAAMVGAWSGTVGMWLLPFFSPMYGDVGSLLLAMVTTVALTLAPVSEPAPRRQLLLAGAVAAAVVIAVLGRGQPTAEFVGVVVLVVGAFGACGASSRVGRRAAVVLLAPVLVALISLLLPIGAPPVVASSLLVGVPVVVLLALGVLPRRSRLRRLPGRARLDSAV
jgi:MYXO-CTERM domain-containing protein